MVKVGIVADVVAAVVVFLLLFGWNTLNVINGQGWDYC